MEKYIIGKYPISEFESICKWWQTHRDYDVNQYSDYIEIVRRSDALIKETLRYEREALLEAFDKWEKAVLRGREEDDENVMQWYRDLLDLKDGVFDNVPERVKYYWRQT